MDKAATEPVKNRFNQQIESINHNIKGLKLQRDLVSKKKNIAEHAKKHGGSGMVVILVLAIIIALVSSSMLATMMTSPSSRD